MIDKNPMAAKDFYKAVRLFAEKKKPWELHISYETKPDEALDLSLVSQRVYGRRDEFLAVMAAAGIDTIDQPLTQRRLVLPNEGQLHAMKRRAGFESIASYREDGVPTWL